MTKEVDAMDFVGEMSQATGVARAKLQMNLPDVSVTLEAVTLTISEDIGKSIFNY